MRKSKCLCDKYKTILHGCSNNKHVTQGLHAFERMHIYSNPFHAAKKCSPDIFGKEKKVLGPKLYEIY